MVEARYLSFIWLNINIHENVKDVLNELFR
jgi:hypothetical protein